MNTSSLLVVLIVPTGSVTFVEDTIRRFCFTAAPHVGSAGSDFSLLISLMKRRFWNVGETSRVSGTVQRGRKTGLKTATHAALNWPFSAPSQNNSADSTQKATLTRCETPVMKRLGMDGVVSCVCVP